MQSQTTIAGRFCLILTILAPWPALAEADAKKPWHQGWGSWGSGTPSVHVELGPMLGHTSSTNAQLWVKASGAARFDVLLSRNADLADARRARGPGLVEASAFMGRLMIEELEPTSKYFYCVLLDGRRATLPPYPSFETPAPEGAAGRVRLAFVSCLGYHGHESAASWGDMTRTNVDLVLMLGDNHYANSSDPAKQRIAYYDQRAVAGFRAITSRVPTYGIWDDHDFGPDNSDGTLKDKELSLQTFQEHWANPGYGESDNPGVYYRFTRGPIEFFMLDDRYYRTPNKAKDAPDRTMLGARQVAWLKRGLIDSTAPVKIIAAGSEWQSYGTEDGWTGFREERDEIFRFIEDNAIEGVVLLSGDRHFTAAYQVTKRFIEITSGPFGSSNANVKPLPEMFFYQGEGKLYCILDVDTTGEKPVLTLEVYRAGNGRVAWRAFTWDEIMGRATIEKLK